MDAQDAAQGVSDVAPVYSDTGLPADAVATFAAKVWPSESLRFGIWGKCALVDCGWPTQFNASINVNGSQVVKALSNSSLASDPSLLDCTGQSYGSSCTPVCKYGYYRDTVDGAGTITCNENRVWVGVAKCLPNLCEVVPPDVPFLTQPASLLEDCNGMLQDERCYIKCPQGPGNDYDIVGQDYFLCDNGAWVRKDTGDSTIECQPRSCSNAPEVLKGEAMANCEGLASGEVCSPVCKPGYDWQGAQSIVCQAGTWSVPTSCMSTTSLGAGVTVENVPAVQVDIEISSFASLVEEGAILNFEWAMENEFLITETTAEVMQVDTANLRIDIINGAALGGSGVMPGSGGRRLQSSNAFRIRAVILLRNNEDPATVIQTINTRILTPDASGQTPFQKALIKNIEASGQPVPLGLREATIRAPTPPKFIEEFLVQVSEWLPMPWEECDTVCGTGLNHRVVNCPTGAGSCNNTMPSTTKDCADYSGCPFEILCPMGQGKQPDCVTQQSIMFGVLGGSMLCWFCIIMRRIYLKCKPPVEGNFHFDEVNQAAQYKVYTPRGGYKDEKRNDITADGKIHVVWEIDQPFVEAWFQDKNKDAGNQVEDNLERFEVPQLASGEDGAGIIPMLEEDDDTDSEDDDDIAPAGDAPTGNFKPVCLFEDGEKVEYFSHTHRRWVIAKIQMTIKDGDDDEELEPIVMYNVVLAHGVTHLNVQLDSLRKPFTHGELVELFSKRDGGQWLPGIIMGTQSAGATMTGYQVQRVDDESKDVFQEIPAIRLRRRFPADMPMNVYRGPRDGWHKLFVHHSAPKDGIGLEAIPFVSAKVSHADLHSLQDIRIREGQLMTSLDEGFDKSRRSPRRKVKDAGEEEVDALVEQSGPESGPSVLDFGLWTQVPVDLSVDDDNDDFVTLPSYLCSMRSLEENSRRQIAL